MSLLSDASDKSKDTEEILKEKYYFRKINKWHASLSKMSSYTCAPRICPLRFLSIRPGHQKATLL